MAKTPYIFSLTPDQRIWRVVWFGECAYPGNISRYAQPSITVVLAPLNCDLAAFTFFDDTDRHHTHQTWVSVATLPLLALGDLWQYGQKIASPDYRVESFQDLQVSSKTTSLVKAGSAVDEKFLLPLQHYPWHLRHTQSYCVAVSLQDGRRLLVPCVELIRFYFGSSGNLVQRLFSAPLKSDRLWKSKRFNVASRHLHLILADYISSASSKDIGRIAESVLAWRAAAGIHSSCQRATANGRPTYPCTGFPFEGVTQIIASGTWLPLGNREAATFLVFRLRSCAYPFPFHSLSYTPGDWKTKSDLSNGSDANSRPKAPAYPPNCPTVAVDVDPGKNWAQRKATYTSEERFPDLRNKRVWRSQVEEIPAPDVYRRRADGSLEPVAVGEASWSSAVPGIDVCVVYDRDLVMQKPVRLPKFVRDGLGDIEKNPAYWTPDRTIKVVCPSGKPEPVFSLPIVLDDNVATTAPRLFTDHKGRTRQRRGCFVELVGQNVSRFFILVLEGESRLHPPALMIADTTEIDLTLNIVCDQIDTNLLRS